MICRDCGGRTCIDCDTVWHPKMTCEEVKRREQEARAAREVEEKAAARYLGKHSKLCPNCQARGTKTIGCDHIKCKNFSFLRFHFPWLLSMLLKVLAAATNIAGPALHPIEKSEPMETIAIKLVVVIIQETYDDFLKDDVMMAEKSMPSKAIILQIFPTLLPHLKNVSTSFQWFHFIFFSQIRSFEFRHRPNPLYWENFQKQKLCNSMIISIYSIQACRKSIIRIQNVSTREV